jgi:hypothetical protein
LGLAESLRELLYTQLPGKQQFLHILRVLKMLKKIFGPKREEEPRNCRKLHSEELHNLYTSPNIIQVIKSRNVRYAGHVACIGETKNA